MNQPHDQLRCWLPTQQTVRQLLAPALVFIVACLDRQFQTDFWMHLARGEEIIRTGRIITADHFTIAGANVLDANWISQVVYSRLFAWGGLSLVQTLNALALAAALWLLVRLCYRGGTSWRSAAAGGVFTFLVAWQTFLIRPQTFSMLLFVLLYGILRNERTTDLKHHSLTPSPRTPGEGRGEGDFEHQVRTTIQITLTPALSRSTGRGGKSPGVLNPSRQAIINAIHTPLLIYPPLILLLWANLHGGFVIGLALIGVFAVAALVDVFRGRAVANAAQLLVVSLVLSTLATLINPYGWRVYQYAFSLTAIVMPRHVEEWMPPRMDQWIGQALALSALLVGGLYCSKRRRPTTRDALLILVFLPLAFHSARMVIWWGIIAAPIVASLIDSVEPDFEQGLSAVGGWMSSSTCAVLLILCVWSLPCFERINPLFMTVRSPHRTETDLETIARAGLASRPNSSGVIFSRMEWCQYLDWRIGPRRRLFIDGHIELASEQAWRDYCEITSGDPRWRQVLDRYNVHYLLLDMTYHSALLPRVKMSKDWRESCHSGDAILFVRRDLDTPAHDANTTYPITNPMEAEMRLAGGGSPMATAAMQHGSSGGIRQFYGR